MNRNAIFLYIFSGPHLGAKIALQEGKTVIGSDDSADIILSAQKESADFAVAGRHAVLQVPENILQEGFVEAEELDGKISIAENEENSEILKIKAGQTFYLGATCMVWNYPNAVQESIIPNLFLNAKPEALSSQNSNPSEQGENLENSSQVTANFVDNNNTDNGETEKLVLAAQSKNKSYKSSILVYILLILGLLALSIYTRPQNDNLNIETDYVISSLAKLGLEDLNVSQGKTNGQANITISGFVNSEAERQEVQKLARSLQYPVYLNLEVNGDLLKAVNDSLKLSGLFPDLAIRDNKLYIASYAKDKLVEEAAFSALRQDVKSLPPIEKNIVYGANLALSLEKALKEQNISYSDIAYNTGQVVLIGDFDSENGQKIHQVMNSVMQKLAIPISYVLRSGEKLQIVEQKSVEPNKGPSNTVSQTLGVFVDEKVLQELTNTQTTTTTVVPKENSVTTFKPITESNTDDPLGSLKITAVNLGPIPFVTTSDGQRLFIGAALPSGFVIEVINADSLTLRKGGHINKINLKNVK